MDSLARQLFPIIQQNAFFQPATNLWRAVELSVLIKDAFPYLRNATQILDLGCGDGEIMRVLKPHLPAGAVLQGVDLDSAEVALAQQTGLYDSVMPADAANMEFPDESQSAVISNSVLEHIPALDDVLREISRVLAEGGYFIATVPSSEFHDCLSGPWFGRDREAYLRELDKRLAHEWYLSQDEWRDKLAAVGVQLVRCVPYLDKKQTRRWELISRVTGGLFYKLSGQQDRPIMTQRKLGLRHSTKWPRLLANILGWAMMCGLRCEAQSPNGCLLIVGQKAPLD